MKLTKIRRQALQSIRAGKTAHVSYVVKDLQRMGLVTINRGVPSLTQRGVDLCQ